MLRRWIALALIVLQLQPALALVPAQAASLALEIEHAWVHQMGQGHHHDAALTLDAQVESSTLAHVHHDAGHHSALTLAFPVLNLPLTESSGPVVYFGERLPNPHLEGLLRPPRRSL